MNNQGWIDYKLIELQKRDQCQKRMFKAILENLEALKELQRHLRSPHR